MTHRFDKAGKAGLGANLCLPRCLWAVHSVRMEADLDQRVGLLPLARLGQVLPVGDHDHQGPRAPGPPAVLDLDPKRPLDGVQELTSVCVPLQLLDVDVCLFQVGQGGVEESVD